MPTLLGQVLHSALSAPSCAEIVELEPESEPDAVDGSVVLVPRALDVALLFVSRRNGESATGRGQYETYTSIVFTERLDELELVTTGAAMVVV